jgi:hypothetical protein
VPVESDMAGKLDVSLLSNASNGVHTAGIQRILTVWVVDIPLGFPRKPFTRAGVADKVLELAAPRLQKTKRSTS